MNSIFRYITLFTFANYILEKCIQVHPKNLDTTHTIKHFMYTIQMTLPQSTINFLMCKNNTKLLNS